MTAIRNRRSGNFTTIPNETIRNPKLSLQCKGLLTLMLSRQDDWVYHLSEVETHSTNGRDATRAAFRELEAAGYIHRQPLRIRATGQLKGWEFIVSDVPTFLLNGDATVSLETRPTVGPPDGKAEAKKKEANKTEKKNTRPAVADQRTEQNATETEKTAEKEKSAGQTAAFLLLGIWNDHCGRLPEAKPTERRLKTLSRISAEFGSAAEATIRAATLEVAADEFWQKRGYGLDTLLAGDKFVGKAEAWLARSGLQSAPQETVLNEDVTEGLF